MQKLEVQALVATLIVFEGTVSPCGDYTNGLTTRFDLTLVEHKLSVSEAWQTTYH